MTGIHPMARSQADLLPGLGLPTYSGCLGQWWKAELEEGGSGFTPSGVWYGRGADPTALVVPVNNFSHYFRLSVCLSVTLLFVFPGFPSQLHSPFTGTPVANPCYWYLKLMVLVNFSEILLLCHWPCSKWWPLGIPVCAIKMFNTPWKSFFCLANFWIITELNKAAISWGK